MKGLLTHTKSSPQAGVNVLCSEVCMAITSGEFLNSLAAAGVAVLHSLPLVH